MIDNVHYLHRPSKLSGIVVDLAAEAAWRRYLEAHAAFEATPCAATRVDVRARHIEWLDTQNLTLPAIKRLAEEADELRREYISARWRSGLATLGAISADEYRAGPLPPRGPVGGDAA